MIFFCLLISVLLATVVNRAATINAVRSVDEVQPVYVQWAWLVFVLTHWLGGNSMVNAFSGCTTHRRRYVVFVGLGWPVISACLFLIGLVCLARLGFDKLVPQGIHMFDAPCACGHCAHGLAK